MNFNYEDNAFMANVVFVLKWIGILTVVTVMLISLLILYDVFVGDLFSTKLNGEHSLGRGLYFISKNYEPHSVCFGLKMKDEALVAQIPVIPMPNDSANEGIKEEVMEIKHDSNWIIANTVKGNEHNYYIISKDFDPNSIFDEYEGNDPDSLVNNTYKTNFECFLDKNIRSFNDSIDFLKECQNLGIALKLN